MRVSNSIRRLDGLLSRSWEPAPKSVQPEHRTESRPEHTGSVVGVSAYSRIELDDPRGPL